MQEETANSIEGWNRTRGNSLSWEWTTRSFKDRSGGLSTQRLTSAVSNFGGLGSFGARGFDIGNRQYCRSGS
jgi:nitronate monooxygenase